MSARLQIILGRGQDGIPLKVLSEVVEETSGFLRSLGSDLGDVGDWVAHNFRDGSVIFDLERATESEEAASRWRRGLSSVIGGGREDEEMEVIVSRATRERLQRVARAIPEEQAIEFGVFKNGEVKPETQFIIPHGSTIAEFPERGELQSYFGEIQGTVHAFYKESQPRRLVVRELATEKLVKCDFPDEMYQSAVEVLKDKDAVVFVEGEITENDSGQITQVSVSDFTPAPAFDEEWMEKKIGAFPDVLSGDLSPVEAVELYRTRE